MPFVLAFVVLAIWRRLDLLPILPLYMGFRFLRSYYTLGSTLSLIEILRVLYDSVLHHRPEEPQWPGRDRMILSKGHGCLAQYALLADKGYFPEAELDSFCGLNARLGGHPEFGKLPGIEASTGALGHGLPIGVGLALAARLRREDWRVFVVLGDGEINEGSNWEAALGAAKHGLGALTVLIDYNKIQSYGPTRDVLDLEPLADKWRAFGFDVAEVDGHNVAALEAVLAPERLGGTHPRAIICHTIKGKGIPLAENDPTWHHKSRFKDHERQAITDALGEF